MAKMAAAGLSDAQIEEFREAFHLFDRNQDGTIVKYDLANVLKVGIESLSRLCVTIRIFVFHKFLSTYNISIFKFLTSFSLDFHK